MQRRYPLNLCDLPNRLVALRDDPERAEGLYDRAFNLAVEHHRLGYGMEAVVGRATILADRGDQEQAARLLHFVDTFELTPVWTRADAHERLQVVERPVTPMSLDEVRAAMATVKV